MKCIKCGKDLCPKIINGQFTGDYYCEKCNLGVNDCVYREPIKVALVEDKSKEEFALYKRALELACEFMEEDCYWYNNLLPVWVEKERIFEYFLEKAKENTDVKD